MPAETQLRYRGVIGHFATGVSVVTGLGEDGPVGLTANSVCSVSLEPLLLLVCFENTARTLPIVQASGRFAVNVLSREQSELSRTFASKRPEAEKFVGVPYTLRDGVPVIDGALAWLVCDLQQTIVAGDHTIGIGAVGPMGHDGERDPLVFYRGEYRTIRPNSPHLGLAPD